MKNLSFLLAWLILLVCTQKIGAQSAGSITLYLIESKVKLIVENDKNVSDANTKRMNSFVEEQDRESQLRKELNNLISEKAIALQEYREGRFCRGCDQTASQLRSKGIADVEDHFRANGGTYSPSPEMILAKSREFDNKISAKESELANVSIEYSQKRLELDRIIAEGANENQKFRSEIYELSKKYNSVIINEARETYEAWNELMIRIVAEKHYVEDRIDIFTVKLEDLEVEKAKQIKATEKKVETEISEKIKKIDEQIDDYESLLRDILTRKNVEIAKVESELRGLWKDHLKIKDELIYNKSLSQAEVKKLEAEKAELESLIAVQEEKKESVLKEFQLRKSDTESKIEDSKESRWKLTSNLNTFKTEAVALVKEGFEIKKSILEEAKAARMSRLKELGELYLAKKADYKEKAREKSDAVYSERSRLVNACAVSASNCTGYDTYLEVSSLWDKIFHCTECIVNRNLLVYNCDEPIANYKSQYANFLNGLSDEDLSALQRKTTSTRFNTILKIISQ
jgi:hypothetical protein